MTSIVARNATGWVLPAQIIFAATKHQYLWYHELPEDYTISVSKKGWTTDQVGALWLYKVFEPYTASTTIGKHSVTALQLAVSRLDRLHGLPISDVPLFLCLDYARVYIRPHCLISSSSSFFSSHA